MFGQSLGINRGSKNLIYTELSASGFNLLYFDGPRDSLSAGNVVFRLFAENTGGSRQYLSMAKQQQATKSIKTNTKTQNTKQIKTLLLETSQRVTWSGNRSDAVLCQLRGAQTVDNQSSFAVGIVAGDWVLSSDRDLQLQWGVASASQALSPVFATIDGSLESALNFPKEWTVQRGVSQYKINQSLALQLALVNPTGVRLGFEASPQDRLMLGWTVSTTENSVSICRPDLLASEANVKSLRPVFVDLPTEPETIVGQSNMPGCRLLARSGDEPENTFPNWFPVVQPLVTGGSSLLAMLTWFSANLQLYLSAQSGAQATQRAVRLYPMALGAACVVDAETNAVVPNAGAMRLNLLDSNISAYPMYAGQKHIIGQPTCDVYFAQKLAQKDDDGTCWIFESSACSVQAQYYRLSATESIGPVSMRIGAIIVPENIQLFLRQVGSLAVLFLRPGTYTAQSLVVQDTRWPASGLVTFVAYCSNVAPPQFYVANACMGSAATESQVWIKGNADCNSFFDVQCPNGALKNAAQCGCYQDISWIQSLGLRETGAKMVNAPQCWGRVCPLGSAYRKSIWTTGCGTICSQLIAGSGNDWYQSGRQTMACGGNVYNTQAPETAPVVTGDQTGWYIAIVFAGVVALLFLALFVVFYIRNKHLTEQETQTQTQTSTEGRDVVGLV
jgi:hypothetical protein